MSARLYDFPAEPEHLVTMLRKATSARPYVGHTERDTAILALVDQLAEAYQPLVAFEMAKTLRAKLHTQGFLISREYDMLRAFEGEPESELEEDYEREPEEDNADL